MTRIGFETHDHTTCIAGSMAATEAACIERGLRLTRGRRRVLEILLEEHRAMGAYDILGLMADEGFGAQPPVVYRALDFLVGNGFAHRIERLNAYVACTHPTDDHAPVFLICRICGAVAETGLPTRTSLGTAARAAGFAIESTVIEAEGLCPACQETAPE